MATENFKKKPILLIPAYKPEPVLLEIANNLIATNAFEGVIIVNDGSGVAYDGLFKTISEIKGVCLLRHCINLGKGAALKTGMNMAACIFPDSPGIVTADADGQHGAEDILKVSEALIKDPNALILGVRSFDSEVPWRSKFGNTVTRHALRLITGQNVKDTQTGLRGIPMEMVFQLMRIPSSRYEFELDMLLTCKYTRRKIVQTGIMTIYINDNSSSHFDPIIDSIRIYSVLLRFAVASVIAAIIDSLIFVIFYLYWQNIAGSQAAAKFAGAFFNYFANKKHAVQSKEKIIQTLSKYLLLTIAFGLISYHLLIFISSITGFSIAESKIIAEIIIFFFNFIVQRDYVFFRKDGRQR